MVGGGWPSLVVPNVGGEGAGPIARDVLSCLNIDGTGCTGWFHVSYVHGPS